MDWDRSGRQCPRIDALRLVIKQYQECRFWLYHREMAALSIQLDRARRSPLTAQIYSAIREGIENGRLASGARLPSWQDLAAQLGVSRGTVRVAYERLIAEQFAIGLGPAGTRVAERQSGFSPPDGSPEAPLLPDILYEFGNAPLTFQMGVPAQDAFPFKLWSCILTRETRRAAAGPVTYPDLRGDPELRKEVAAYLGLARGVRCHPSQVLITAGSPVRSVWRSEGFSLGGCEPGSRIQAFRSRASHSAWLAWL
jgi:GntR family transcriptional regulator/MocR family aminotransferase